MIYRLFVFPGLCTVPWYKWYRWYTWYKKASKNALKTPKTWFLTLILKQFTYKKACFLRKIDPKTSLFCRFLLVFGRKNEVFLRFFAINNIIIAIGIHLSGGC